jgi:hypothetical protein
MRRARGKSGDGQQQECRKQPQPLVFTGHHDRTFLPSAPDAAG